LRAAERLSWTRELYEGRFTSLNELTADELSADKLKARLAAAQESQGIFKRHTLPMQVWQRCSDCARLARELDRVKARAASQLAQAEAKLRSSEAIYRLQKDRLDEVRDQIRKCTMRAVRPGQVIYGSRDDPIWYRLGDSSIRPGTMVEQNRTIIRIPDPSTLAAIVNVHESDIQDIKVGQRALVTLVAEPGRTLRGRVTMASPVAKSAGASLDPDAIVYEVDVALEEMPERFIPGMSSTVEIIVAELQDVLYVPRQAVNRYRDIAYCWVEGTDRPQVRRVETGHRSVKYVEIRRGLRAGEEVLLAEPLEPAPAELDALTR
jgi:HlyD family secretion protein